MPTESHSLNVLTLITEASPVVQAVMLVLLTFSIYGWMLIFTFKSRLSAAESSDNEFESMFSSSANLKLLAQRSFAAKSKASLGAIFADAFEYYDSLKKNGQFQTAELERVLRVSLQRKQQALESGLGALASIGSVSPYIGLFGTVWGIMNAFLGLSTDAQSSLSAVAPGIAEALIATALGLFAAIPAVLAYNHFTSKLTRLHQSRALVCDEIIGVFVNDQMQKSKDVA